jgi:hypothetical protein
MDCDDQTGPARIACLEQAIHALATEQAAISCYPDPPLPSDEKAACDARRNALSDRMRPLEQAVAWAKIGPGPFWATTEQQVELGAACPTDGWPGHARFGAPGGVASGSWVVCQGGRAVALLGQGQSSSGHYSTEAYRDDGTSVTVDGDVVTWTERWTCERCRVEIVNTSVLRVRPRALTAGSAKLLADLVGPVAGDLRDPRTWTALAR